ncbi:MAG TPA: hypothetical protein VD816_12835 [Ohtaekwangia sp.]|nr:hypothetical protein [Ohtaekwangia sp.]
MNFRLLRLNVLLLFFVTSCGPQIPELKQINLKEWKSDKLGCNGTRAKSVETLQSQKKVLLGLTEMEIVTTLGKPDVKELGKRNQKFFRYLLEPGIACSDSAAAPRKLIVRFNAVGRAKEITIE